MGDPKTWAEKLDQAAADDDQGEAFGAVLNQLFVAAFVAAEKAKQADND